MIALVKSLNELLASTMWDEEIHKGAILMGVVIVIIVGIVVAPSVWKDPNQIVQNSGNPQLQTAYQTGKEMINTTGDLKDGSDLTNSVRNLGG